MYTVYYATLFFLILFLSTHLLPRINVMLNFSCMGSVELQRTQTKQKLQSEKKYCPKRDSNQRPAPLIPYEAIALATQQDLNYLIRTWWLRKLR